MSEEQGTPELRPGEDCDERSSDGTVKLRPPGRSVPMREAPVAAGRLPGA